MSFRFMTRYALLVGTTMLATSLITLIPFRSAHATGDGARGSDLFEEECAECHSVQAGRNKKGPSLFGVVGRPSGTVANYHYSDAMKNAQLTWTPETLSRYLTAPKTTVPGTKMKYSGLNDQQQQTDLIAFLAGQH